MMDLEKHRRKKIIKYIERDKYSKLKSYVKDNNINLNEIITKRGEKMLHLASKEGSVDCLAYLLKAGANPTLVDKKGNLPIHLALKYCIGDYTKTNESDLVSLLLTYSSQLIKQKNFSGVSVQELLDEMEKVKRNYMFYKEKRKFEDTKTLSDSDQDTGDKEWGKKLQDECDYEFEENMGKYEYDYSYTEPEHESFDDWADRIYATFSQRRRSLYGAPKKESPKDSGASTSKKPKLNLDQSKTAYIELKQKNEKRKYEKMVQKLFSSTENICATDIPFEDFSATKIVDTLLDGVKEKSKDEIKVKIREEIRRWHPDKFMQKVGERIVENEREKVMEKVKAISQALNVYGK